MGRTAASRCSRLSALVGCLLLTGCAGSADRAAAPPAPTADPSLTIEYAPGLSTDVYLPKGAGRVPLVVLVPGGSWTTADPAGLAELSAYLAGAGVVAAPTEIRAAEDDVLHPAPVEDVLCALAAVDERARSRGFDPDPVVVLGHSSGAQLAALAVLAVDDYSPDCGAPAVAPDALIGLSGPYDISRIPDVAAALLGSGPDDDPETWASANPVERAGLRPDVPVLLLHGESDDVVPVDFTTQFADALTNAGHPTATRLLPGVDHLGILRADVAGAEIDAWLRRLGR